MDWGEAVLPEPSPDAAAAAAALVRTSDRSWE